MRDEGDGHRTANVARRAAPVHVVVVVDVDVVVDVVLDLMWNVRVKGKVALVERIDVGWGGRGSGRGSVRDG